MLTSGDLMAELVHRLCRLKLVTARQALVIEAQTQQVDALRGRLIDAVFEREQALDAVRTYRKSIDCVVVLWDAGQIGARGESAEALQAMSDSWHRVGR